MNRIGLLFLLLTLAGCDFINDITRPGGDGPPTVTSVSPSDSASSVSVGSSVIVSLRLPNGGLNPTSVDSNSVRLIDTATGSAVASNVSVYNETESLVLAPSAQLEFSTTYRFEITSAVVDESGQSLLDTSSTFTTVSADVPSVTASEPADGETGVDVNIPGISAAINTRNGVSDSSITDDSVYLETSGGARVEGSLGATGGRDGISFNPSQALEAGTTYRFNVTSAVTNNSGTAFAPYTGTFTTATGGGVIDPTGEIATIPQSTAARVRHTSLTVDPSGTFLYAATAQGDIDRYPIGTDGTLGTPTTLSPITQAEGEPRLLVGLTFDPASTTSNPIVWVTHTALPSIDGGEIGGGVTDFWAGKLSRLSGPNFETVQDYVIGLPRSNRDHVTNSVAFNPAEPGVVYFVQGSNTAMGAPDGSWGYQPERVLSGAVLRLDTNQLGSLPLNAQSEDGGTYNPYAPGAPLTVYGSGTRNSYDLVWHSNGNLYVPANGSRAGGNVPRYNPLPGTCENRPDGGYSGPVLDDPSDVSGDYIATGENDLGQTVPVEGWRINQTLEDYLFKIEEGGYYGTPNPKRCEWILNGGKVGFPGYPSTVVGQYPDGTGYDPNYRGPAGSFGASISPNGVIEYKGSAFPDLQGKLLVARYSGGDDIVAVTLGSDGNSVGEFTPIIETPSGLIDPLDITENPITGHMYVSWFNALGGEAAPEAGITLLRPQ